MVPRADLALSSLLTASKSRAVVGSAENWLMEKSVTGRASESSDVGRQHRMLPWSTSDLQQV